MSEKIKLVLGENVHINRNVLVYDGKEKKPTFHVYHYRKSLWLPDNTVSAFLEEENEYSQINGDYILEGEVRATEPGKYTAVLRGVHRYECEIPLEWEIFSPDDPRITENPYADYFLGKKNKYELSTFNLHPLNMDEIRTCDLPNYEQVIRYYPRGSEILITMLLLGCHYSNCQFEFTNGHESSKRYLWGLSLC